MNTTDLRNLLAERAHTGAPDPAADVRVAGALNRARSIHRRRRITAATTTVAAIAIAVAVIIVPSQLTTPDPQPQPARELNEHGLPLYDRGHELIESGVIRTGERAVSIPVTPSAFPLVVVAQCGEDEIYGEEEETPEVNIDISVGEQEFVSSGGSCGYTWSSDDADGWAEWGLRAGEPATFTATTDQPVTAETEVAIGIYQAVPWSEYTFPARPDTLPELWPDDLAEPELVLWSDPADPNASRQILVDYEWLSIQVLSQTPGIIRLRVNGEDQAPLFFWDYPYTNDLLLPASDPDDWPLEPLETPVEIEVRPEGFTGEWRLHVIECTRAGACGW